MSFRVDEYGRVILDADGLVELVLKGQHDWGWAHVLAEPGAETERFNALCRQRANEDYRLRLPEALGHTPEQEHARRADEWLFPTEMRDVHVRAFLLSLCATDDERTRIHEEMDLYEERDLIPLLQAMIYMVDHFRTHKVVWGVGRGSSVASFVLYKIGVHKINPLRFGLGIKEFLKD